MSNTIQILTLVSSIFLAVDVYAWNDKITHADMSEYAAERSILSLSKGDYLKNLGLDKNLDEIFILNGKSKKLRLWLREGAVEEDAGTKTEALAGKARYLNHFHNPLKPWLDAGLTGFFSGESSVLWSQDGAKQASAVGGDWSWLTLRHFYYLALTSTTNADRQAFFAQTFRGLGHQLHLIQDMSQPAHVRNDAHPADDSGYIPGFEYWAKQPTNEPIVKPLMANPIFPTVDAPITISRFYDTDQYDGTNPSASLSQGLAEYTNANFASEDTIFNAFTYPRWADMQYYEEPAGTWGSFYKYRKYYRKIGGGEQVEHFVNAGRLTKYLDSYTVLQTSTLGLDNQCYKDYASLLLPRAVGYSAGLLNYFFRGQMDVTEDPDNPGQYVLENKTGEIMKGSFELYYDDDEDNREKLGVGYWPLDGQEIELAASGENSKRTGIMFNAPPPKPKGDKYILVFQGKLGNEEGAVVGKIVDLSPIWEPWDTGEYVTTRSDTQYWNEEMFKVYNEWFTLATSKHTWSGVWQAWASPDTNIRVEDGHLKADVYVGGYSDGYYKSRAGGSIYITDFSGDTPVSGCKIKINMPSVTTNNLGDFRISINMSNGINHWNQPYRLAEATSPVGLDWDELFIWVNAGLIERDLEADLRRGVPIQAQYSWWDYGTPDEFIGNIDQWHVTSLSLMYHFNSLNTNFSFSIDYIDFDCE